MKWKKVEAGDGRVGGKPARWESEDGWAIESVRPRGGPLGTQARRTSAHLYYQLIGPDGRDRADQTSTLAGAKRAAVRRRDIEARRKEAEG